MSEEFKECKCEKSYPFITEVCLFSARFPIYYNAKCIFCGRKVTRLTRRGLIKAWNKIAI